MPRSLNDKPCEVVFHDRISNSKITLFYRLPTTEERIGYSNAQIIRKGNSVKNNMGEARLKYGMLILKGFKDGDFEKDENQPLSSDPKSSHYDAAWKTFIKQYASDIVSLLAVHAFDASVTTESPELPESDDEESTGADPEDKDENPL